MAENTNNRERSTDREKTAAAEFRLLACWSIGGAERFGQDGGTAADTSADERRADPRCKDLALAITRGLIAQTYLDNGYGLASSAKRLGMDMVFGEAAAVRMAADVRLLNACERGLLAHVGIAHEMLLDIAPDTDGMPLNVVRLTKCPATPLTLVQAEIVVGVRDFDGEYAGAFAPLGVLEDAKAGPNSPNTRGGAA